MTVTAPGTVDTAASGSPEAAWLRRRFDRANHPPPWWRIKYLALAWWFAALRNRSVRV